MGPFSVSAIGFGAMRLTGPGVFGPPKDHDEALAVLREAVDSGVDHIDTAQFYGPDVVNELIREALYPYPKNLILVSKVGARRDRHGRVLAAQEPAHLRQGIEDNLGTLGIDALRRAGSGGFPWPARRRPGSGAAGRHAGAGRAGLGVGRRAEHAGHPGTSSRRHLRENLAAASVNLDADAVRRLSLR